MHDISVIIVNYNVQFFLQQCIQSVLNASKSLRVEIIVVDNASVDGSLNMLASEFPDVTVLANPTNVGFAVANNQGIRAASGKYILLLNPDTLVEENTLDICFSACEEDASIGALGVKLMDGSGRFLPESKRGFPTASAAFFKFSGIYKLFKRSRVINKYYVGNIDKDERGEVDVLCGAFMFMPADVLRAVGMLDEAYFMYGEDIDLSYKIKSSGKKIIYLPTTSIIHYKGESTKKGSKRYNTAFYGAMRIFLNKHFSTTSSKITLGFLNVMIFVLGIFSAAKHRFLLPIKMMLDVGITFISSVLLTQLWSKWYYGSSDYYESSLFIPAICIISVVAVFIYYLIGHYDEEAKRQRYLSTSVTFALTVIVIYGLLPEGFRFSRLLILAYLLICCVICYLTRMLYNKLSGQGLQYEIDTKNESVIIGEKNSCKQVAQLVSDSHTRTILGFISPKIDASYDTTFFLTDVENLKRVVKTLHVNEVIFCSKDIIMSDIFKVMTSLGHRLKYRIANNSNDNYLGSDNKNVPGNWFTRLVAFNLSAPSNRRLKYMFDKISGLISLVLFPYFLIRSKQTRILLSNAIPLILGLKTLFGYDATNNLPALRKNIFNVTGLQNKELSAFEYAKEYSVVNDIFLWMSMVIYG